MKNPYRKNTQYYQIMENLIRFKDIGLTRKRLEEAGYSSSAIKIVLSPRVNSKGHISSKGNSYFVEKQKGLFGFNYFVKSRERPLQTKNKLKGLIH